MPRSSRRSWARTLGGYITDEYSWRWIFYINLPVGGLAFLLCYFTVQDPEYLRAARAEGKRHPTRFDSIGLGLLVVALVCWEVLLSKGQEWDWLGDPFGRVQTLLLLLILGGAGLYFWESRHANPVVNFRPLRDRNFSLACLIIFLAYAVLYGSSTLLPGMLEALFGYDAFHAGLVLSPAGFFSIMALLIVGRLLMDARWLMAFGLVLLGTGNFWLSRLNLDIAPGQVIWPRVVLVAGLGFVFAPLNVAAYLYMPRELRGAAVGLLALLRNEGGSVGVSISQTIQERRECFHALRLNEGPNTLKPGGEFLPRPGTGPVRAGERRPGRVSADGVTVVGEPARTAGVGAGLFRRLPDLRSGWQPARLPGPVHAAFGRREGHAYCRRIADLTQSPWPRSRRVQPPWAGSASAPRRPGSRAGDPPKTCRE